MLLHDKGFRRLFQGVTALTVCHQYWMKQYPEVSPCSDHSACLLFGDICDGEFDCSDDEDEQNCKNPCRGNSCTAQI